MCESVRDRGHETGGAGRRWGVALGDLMDSGPCAR